MIKLDTDRLHRLRVALNLSQAELAQMIGVSQAAVSDWEACSLAKRYNKKCYLTVCYYKV